MDKHGCWFCGGEGVIGQYAFTFTCPKCGGSGLQRDANRLERNERDHERRRKPKTARREQ
jgi:predicted RNA-binding Zn-ribbon protein involved in translation (DUF1610 family)